MDMVVSVVFLAKTFKRSKHVKRNRNAYIPEIAHNCQLNAVFFHLNQYV